MKPKDIEVGGFYVHKRGWDVRHMVEIRPDGDFFWQSYDIDNGAPLDYGVCSAKGMAAWALRRATPEEISRLRVGH